MSDSRLTDEFSQMQKQLETELETYIKEMRGRRKRHGIGNNLLVLASILTSAAITIAGIYDQAKFAAILGILLTVLLSVQQAFPLGEMAFFYRNSIADLENLQSSLRFTTNTQEEVEKTAHQFTVIRKHIAQAIPRGQGLNSLQNMRDELHMTQ
ncbi:MAG TPA: hypothetical protein VLA49_05525 [Anaerolineales bacterium]|nr:hypothetical protein [Anaerolineales bacterium]